MHVSQPKLGPLLNKQPNFIIFNKINAHEPSQGKERKELPELQERGAGQVLPCVRTGEH
jgi:hypothetical protein